MTTTDEPAESAAMDGDWQRGQEIKRRRLALGIRSLREFTEATKISRNAITAAEDGHGSRQTYERLEAWLDRFEEETASHDDSPAMPMPLETIEFTVEGQDVRVTVKGPVADREQLKRDVADIIRSIRQTEG